MWFEFQYFYFFWRVGVFLKNFVIGVDFYFLFVVGSFLILVGSVENFMICFDVVVFSFFLGCVFQVVYFFLWIQINKGLIFDGCVFLRFRYTFQCFDQGVVFVVSFVYFFKQFVVFFVLVFLIVFFQGRLQFLFFF